ncbi:unnamed protein product [Adineta ricciae]|uniref:RRM domain-containing protein n=1 Tax=Adineta ricciae TaxID=249248 RepID=A0A815PXL6_ADIRI|nr:unnamed protein product [Adineta ricciae]
MFELLMKIIIYLYQLCIVYLEHSASTRNLTEHGKSAGPEPNSILGIFGLSPRTTENSLRDAFGRFGQVKDVQIIMDKKTSKSRGFGFVYYDTIEEATRAKESMRSIKFDGRAVRIDFSVTKCAHEPTPGVYMGQPVRRTSDRSATIYRRSDHHDRKRFRSRSRSRSSSRHHHSNISIMSQISSNQNSWLLFPQSSPIQNGATNVSVIGQPTVLPPQMYPNSQLQMLSPILMNPPGKARYHIPRVNPSNLDDIPTEYRAMLAINYPPRNDDDIDGWFTYFQYEVAIYRQAMRRIVFDVMQLRHQHRILVAANTDLQSKIDNYDKKKKVLYELFQGDKVDKEKVREIFNRLNGKIAAQTRELKTHEVQISGYERELTRREELRAKYDQLVRKSQAREAEIKTTKERIDRAEALEDTIKYQERVIEKLQSMISNYMRQRRSEGTINDIDRTLLTEHAALGVETKRLMRNRPADQTGTLVNNRQEIIRQTQARQQDLEQQNRAFQRELDALSAEFEETAENWKKEKADLLQQIDAIDKPPTTRRAQDNNPN